VRETPYIVSRRDAPDGSDSREIGRAYDGQRVQELVAGSRNNEGHSTSTVFSVTFVDGTPAIAPESRPDFLVLLVADCEFCGEEDGRHRETCYLDPLAELVERDPREDRDEVFMNATVCEYAGHFEDASGRRGDWCECGYEYVVAAARLELVAATASLLRDIPSSAPHYVERLRAAWRSMAAAAEAASLAGHDLPEFDDVGDGAELASDLSVTEIYLARNSGEVRS